MKRYISFSTLSILMLCLLFVECIPEDIALPYRVQSVTTSNATDITARKATLSGEVSLVDTDTITCGIIYGETSDLSAFKGTKVTTTAKDSFAISLSNLKADTEYYYCAYAVDAGRYKLGKVRSFTTCYDASVVTGEPSKVAVHEASLAGEVNDSRETLPCGFIYNTSSDLSLEKASKVSTMSQGKYSITLTKLEANTTYYYCAYVITYDEYKFGEVRSFTTKKEITVTTGDVNSVTSNSAIVGGVIHNAEHPLDCGIIHGLSSELSSVSGTKVSTTSQGEYSVTLDALDSNVTYYYRAYVIVDGEYKYGDVRSFTTKKEISITTGDVHSVTSNGAIVSGVIHNAEHPLDCGILYGLSSELSSVSGTRVSTTSHGEYSVTLSELESNTTYYYRAYVIVDGEYYYGEVREFTTQEVITITTGEATDITSDGATLNGIVSKTDASFQCWFDYGTLPTKLDGCSSFAYTGPSGEFCTTLNDLQPNTTYYYQAVVRNGVEHIYGEVRSFTTEASKTYSVNGVSFTMIGVEGGTFTMGSPDSDSEAYSSEKPAHQVTLSSYYIGETEVTQALWQAVMGSNPSSFTGDLQRPVEKVSWDDCQTFISKLNELTGENFRLPTEAEWEYAARGGSASKGYKYSGSNNIDDVAWYDDNSSNKTHVVKTKQPNELGIYDMSGNVYEWCSDWYGDYSSSAQTNPTGPSSGSSRVLRGGGRDNIAGYCRVAIRNYTSPDIRDFSLGLRIVR